jgi:hypothetical protein
MIGWRLNHLRGRNYEVLLGQILTVASDALAYTAGYIVSCYEAHAAYHALIHLLLLVAHMIAHKIELKLSPLLNFNFFFFFFLQSKFLSLLKTFFFYFNERNILHFWSN